jgi:hypothetical protein
MKIAILTDSERSFIMKVLIFLVSFLLIYTPTFSETNVSTKLFFLNEVIELNGMDISDNFGVNKNYNPIEIKPSWINESIEISYVYRSRKVFDGIGKPSNFIFNGIEFDTKGKDDYITISGSVLYHTVDFKIKRFKYFSPIVRWSYIDCSVMSSGKEKKTQESINVKNSWVSSSIGAGLCSEYLYKNPRIPGGFLAKGDFFYYLNRNGLLTNVSASYVKDSYIAGVGYRYEYNKIKEIKIESKGPFLIVGISF